MRFLLVLIVCMFVAAPSTLSAATSTPANTTVSPSEEALGNLTSLKIKEVQKLIGRKMTFREKVSFLILKHTSKRESQSRGGSTALGFGIAALAFIFLVFLTPYIIFLSVPAAILAIVLGNKAKRRDPSDKKAQTAVILGWIAVGALVLIAVAAVMVASIEFY